MKFLAEIVEKTVQKDEEGRIINKEAGFFYKRRIRIGFITNFGSANTRNTYGIEVTSTHRTFTFDTASLNEFIRYQNKIYRIKQVIEYPRSSALILELV